MGSGVEVTVESTPAVRRPGLVVRMLGPLEIWKGETRLALPASRKVRALFAYLALAPRPVARSQLCELLWDVPNDPRGELRWCLSKLRRLLDEPERRRVVAALDAVRLDLEGCRVDALAVLDAAPTLAILAPEQLRELVTPWRGELMAGLELDRSPAFAAWLTGQRRRLHALHVAALERLAATAAGEEAQAHLEAWLEQAPFDPRAHAQLLASLARAGRIGEGEAHLAASVRRFEAEGLDGAPLHQAWRSARVAPRVGGAASEPEATPSTAARRASLAVMPFADHGAAAEGRAGIAGALVHDVITRLAKLRALFVIAQGTVFTLAERRVGPQDAGRMLDVDYVVSGSVQQRGGRLLVMAELSETRSARILWAESFSYRLDDTFLVLDAIGDRIVASVAGEVEASERNRAILRPPSSLDAWSAHHRGLWHMYRFNRADNEQARHFFELAARLDPTFARAHAGLSFTYWQGAFQGWEPRAAAVDRAFAAAGQSMMADARDPAAHWALGRAHWLRGQRDQALAELQQAVELSPNFALGHYTLAFIHATGGDPAQAVVSADHSRRLSPFDPLLFGMLGSRAMGLARLGRFAEAADAASKAAARPNAHAHILALAAFLSARAGRLDAGRGYLATIRATRPDYRVEDLIAAMQLEADGAAGMRAGALVLGS